MSWAGVSYYMKYSYPTNKLIVLVWRLQLKFAAKKVNFIYFFSLYCFQRVRRFSYQNGFRAKNGFRTKTVFHAAE
jgi:hypothetical protein